MKSLSMKRLLILSALCLAIGAGSFLPLFNQPVVIAQTNTFCAANLTCTLTAAWTFRANTTLSTVNTGTCYIDGTTWTSISNAVSSGTCTEINDRGLLSQTLGSITFNRSVRVLLGCGNYTTTGLIFNAPVHLEGCLTSTNGNFNGTSISSTNTGAGSAGAAVTISWSTLSPPGGALLQDIAFQGPGIGTTSTGLYFTTTVNTNLTVSRCQFQTFGVGTATSATAVIGFTRFLDVNWFNNAQNINFVAGSQGENIFFNYVVINSSSTWANGFVIAGSGLSVHIVSSSIDYTQFVCSAGRVKIDNGYWEESNAITGGVTPIQLSGCNAMFTTNEMSYPDSSNLNFINVSGGNLEVNGLIANGGAGANAVINVGTGNLFIYPMPILVGYTIPYTTVGAGRVNPSYSFSGGRIGLQSTGSASDVDFGWGQISSSAAGANNWQIISTATGTATGVAGDLDFWNGSNYFELGPGVGGIKTTNGLLRAVTNTVALTADWTCGTGGTVASCTSATIIGSGGGVPLTFTLPLVAASYTLQCDGVVGQATAATANQWNLLTATNGATNVTANYTMATAATAYAAGAVTDQASTTTTFNIAPTWTLGGTGTKMPFHIFAKIEGASASGTVLSLQLLAPTVGDLVTIFRGTSCRIF